MASSWRYGKRSKFRAKVSQDSEDYYRLDPKKSSAENCFDIYSALCSRETRDTKRLFLLNGLATLCQQKEQQNKKQISSTRTDSNCSTTLTNISTMTTFKNNLGFSTEELLYCLSASLIHTFTQVRAAALRTIRYVLTTIKDVKAFNYMQLPHLLCRSIDLMLKNDDERVQALKLIRKMLSISADGVSPVLVRCLVSLADTGIEESDNLLRACLATLCEFAVLNPTLLICCGGVTSLTRNVLECHNPRIAESLSGVLLYMLEWPQTRNISGVRLDCLAAPYCDFTYRLGIIDKNKDARELRYTSCRLALLSVLRSWTGTIEFCDPSKPSGLKAIVEALYLNQMEVRKAILELLYELLGLAQPSWTEDYVVALQAVDPSDFQDNWLLSNGFVAAEGRSILPSLASCAPNICEQHLALQLYCFLETGLVNGLVEVVVSSETDVSVAATILIGKILHLMHTHLPADICSISPALPTLISYATQGNQRANAAISALQCYQKMLRNRPASSSLFLDNIIQEGSLIHTRLFRREINGLAYSSRVQSPTLTPANNGVAQLQQIGNTLERTRLDSVSSSDESNSQSSSTRRSSFRLKCKFLPFLENIKVNRLIKDSNVLNSKDGSGWDWEVVSTIIRCNLIRKLEEPNLMFLKNLIGYFKPGHNHFSHQELVHGKALPIYVKVGLDLIDWLLAISPFESVRLLTDFFTDVATQLLAVTTSNRAHDCLFSPQHMTNTMCQQYFLFIGRMCRSPKGISILTNTAVFEHLINLVRNTVHVCYVKLIVSGLDYTLESITRKVLENALTSAKTRSGRLYSTHFLMVLLRSRIPNFEVWGIPLIIQQTKDPDRSVVLAAIDVLEEACHEKYYLEEIVSLWPNVKSIGDIGRVLMARYYSLSRGLNQPKARIKEEIEYWKNGYNKRYVMLVEADTHSSLTLHNRNEDGYYSRRNCNTRPIIIPPNIPTHLYGQMVQTTQGTTALRKFGDLPELMEVVCRAKCSDESECLELKAALWAIAHASTHANGIEFFLESATRIYEKFVFLATKCEVYSVRATCFNSLGVIGSTNAGANVLLKLNWLSVRHDRNTMWPVHHTEDWILGNYSPVRHHYEDMPPYNYSGLEDQIDGSYYTGSYWNLLLSSSSTNRDALGTASASSEAQDANTTTDSIKTSGEEVSGDNISQLTKFSPARAKIEKTSFKQVAGTGISYSASGGGNGLPTSTKSKTLPEGSYLRHNKHQRSLSESKTTDAISLLSSGAGGIVPMSSTGFYHSHRTRYNSCTDSNTSGVSSSESVTGRTAAMGELQQFPLSPIQSMSNLLEIPLTQSSLLRRTSLMGNAISPIDIKGYAQFRSLRRHCRPVLSESAAELYDIVDRMELLSFASFRPRKSSFGDSQRKIKVRSLDRQTSLRMYAHLDTEEVQLPLPSLNPPKFLPQNDLQGPCYAGISLPKNLLDMFPTRNLSRTYVSQDIQDQDLMDINLLTSNQQYLNDSLYNDGGDESSVISSLSDVSSVSKRSKWTGAKHGRSSCLHCCRLRRLHRSQNQIRADGASSVTSLCEMYTSASAALVAAGIQATVALARRGAGTSTAPAVGVPSNKTSLQQHQHQQQQQLSNNSSILCSDLQFHSPESILSEESLPDKLTANILYNVQRLANPVSAKQSKLALLELKQKHPTTFQDICLYSEVCRTLGRSSYRMNARRFLQELFLDLDLDSFYNEPFEIISKKEREVLKNSENKERSSIGSDKLSLLKERMKRDLNSSNNRLDNNSSDCRAETVASTVAPSNNVTVISSQALKSHIKSQPLASVYEASCENLLLDPSPRLKISSISAKTNVKQNCKNFTIESPPAAQPPLNEYNTELRITSDDDDEYDYDNISEDIGNNLLSSQLHKQPITDEIDGVFVRSSSSANSPNPASSSNVLQFAHSTTVLSSQNTYMHGGGSVSTPNSSSNCSDQTTTSNRSSICTITHQPLNCNGTYIRNSSALTSPPLTQTIENENTKFRRGRFYTLELDLSCTKNKFPITDRTKPNMHSTFTSRSIIEKNPATRSPKSSLSITSPTKTITTSSPLLRQHSVGSVSSSNCKFPVSRLSSTTVLNPTPSSTAIMTTLSKPSNTINPKYLITKSLAASLTQPFGTLYCEKRLQSSKSEAVLIQNDSLITVNSESLPSRSKAGTTDTNVGSQDVAVIKINTNSSSSFSYEAQS